MCTLHYVHVLNPFMLSTVSWGGGSFWAFWEVNLRKKDVFLYPSKSINIHSSSNIRGTTYLRLFLSFRKPDVYILSFWHRRQWLEADRPRLNGNGAKGHGVTELKPGQDCAWVCVCTKKFLLSSSSLQISPQTCLKQLVCSGVYRKIYYLKDKIKLYIVYSLGQTLRINVILLNCKEP